MTTGVLTTSFPRHAGDFAGCFVEDLARAEAATGLAVEVIAAGFRGGAGARTEPVVGAPSISVWRVPISVSDGTADLFYGAGAPEVLEQGGAAAWLQALSFWAGLCEATRTRAPAWTRVIAHWLVPCGLVARALVPHLPTTLYAHSGDVALLERLRGGATIGRWLARPGADLVFVSADLRRRFARLTGFEAGRVQPAVAVDRAPEPVPSPLERAAIRSQLGLERPTLLSVGRLVPIKGFDILVRAVALALRRWRADGRREPTVIVLGDGPERARLEAMARTLDVDLRLPGFVPREEVRRWMSAADLYVQPSRRLPNGRTEGLPVAAIEALRLRLPVLATMTGGLPELKNLFGSCGLIEPSVRLVPTEDPQALAAALLPCC